MKAMVLELEQALELLAIHPTKCKIIGDDSNDNGENYNNNNGNDDDNDVGIGTGVRAFGNAPNSMQI